VVAWPNQRGLVTLQGAHQSSKLLFLSGRGSDFRRSDRPSRLIRYKHKVYCAL
jgi:hypothetical protein